MPNNKQQTISNATSEVLATEVEKVLVGMRSIDNIRRAENSIMKENTRERRRAIRFKHGKKMEQHSFVVRRSKPKLKVDSKDNIYFLPKKNVLANKEIKRISNSKIRNLNSYQDIPNGAAFKKHYTYEQHVHFSCF